MFETGYWMLDTDHGAERCFTIIHFERLVLRPMGAILNQAKMGTSCTINITTIHHETPVVSMGRRKEGPAIDFPLEEGKG